MNSEIEHSEIEHSEIEHSEIEHSETRCPDVESPSGICTACGRKWYGWALIYVPSPCDCGGVIKLSTGFIPKGATNMKPIHLIGTVASNSNVVCGPARVLHDPSQLESVERGEVLIVKIPSPDLVPILNVVCAIVSEKGGKTAHLAKVCRELGIPCLVGVKGCMDLKTGQTVVVDTYKGCADAL